MGDKSLNALESVEVMTISISPFQEHNYEFILGLNKVNKEVLIPMDDKDL